VRSVRGEPIDTKAYAKVLVDTILRELDEALPGIKHKDVPPPPTKSC
jgi:hypothetical protein